MVKHYVEKVKYYGDEYMKSPAGIQLKQRCEKIRKDKKPLPTLDRQTLASFEGAEGIEWTFDKVYDIFSILAEITRTRSSNSNVYIVETS